jgi:hypothetical protein
MGFFFFFFFFLGEGVKLDIGYRDFGTNKPSQKIMNYLLPIMFGPPPPNSFLEVFFFHHFLSHYES